MQDAYLKVWERWEQVGAMDEPVGYLYRTAMNVFSKRYRAGVLAIRRTVALAPRVDDFAAAEDRATYGWCSPTLPPRSAQPSCSPRCSGSPPRRRDGRSA